MWFLVIVFVKIVCQRSTISRLGHFGERTSPPMAQAVGSTDVEAYLLCNSNVYVAGGYFKCLMPALSTLPG